MKSKLSFNKIINSILWILLGIAIIFLFIYSRKMLKLSIIL